MGMDVYGVKPMNEDGVYFRATVWEWRSIMYLVRAICSDIVDEPLLAAMEYNDGAGPNDPAVCEQMAERFQKWLHSFPGEQYTPPEIDAQDAPATLLSQRLQAAGWDTRPTCYSVSASELACWVKFLANCRGFEVW